jgi:hypothetical protein
MIAQHLIDNFSLQIENYFNSPGWKAIFNSRLGVIDHDEPWLTLIACYSIFGNQNNFNKNNYDAFTELLRYSGLKNNFCFSSIDKIKLEEKLPEVLSYRNYLREAHKADKFHLYPDRRRKIDEKLTKDIASFEGNTNLDLLIESTSNEKKTTFFVEAKFLSDISYQIRYNPVRDQIIRIIDCGIDYIQNKANKVSYKDFYFLLLTPAIFKNTEFCTYRNSLVKRFSADTSRLFNYKMKEYCDFTEIKRRLPHRDLNDVDWKIIAENIGWITYEEMYKCSLDFSTILDANEAKMIEAFFSERNLILT